MGCESSSTCVEEVPVVSANREWIILGYHVIRVSSIAFFYVAYDDRIEIRLLDNASSRNDGYGINCFTTAPLTAAQQRAFHKALGSTLQRSVD